MTVINPTVGRIVYFYEFGGAPEQPALVVGVHSNDLIALQVFAPNGDITFHPEVPLLQDNHSAGTGTLPHAKWMPYQIGQAKKYEEAAGTK